MDEARCFILQLEIPHLPGMLAKVTAAIGEAGGNIGLIDTLRIDAQRQLIVRKITVSFGTEDMLLEALARIRAITPPVEIVEVSDPITLAHLGGKLRVGYKFPNIDEET